MTRGRFVRLLLCAAMLTAGCKRETRSAAIQMTGGDPDKGKVAIQRYGCYGCHQIPGIPGADGTVGPSLKGIGSRSYLAGQLPNTPENMVKWIHMPREISPNTAMPDTGITSDEARDVAAYLYTLK